MKAVMWAVGPYGDGPWHAIRAKTARGAIAAYINQYGGTRKYIGEVRVKAWDNLDKVLPPDWLSAGLGAFCDVCEMMTWEDDGGKVIAGKVFCGHCAPNTKADQ